MCKRRRQETIAVKSFQVNIGVTDFATQPHCSIHNFYGPEELVSVKEELAEEFPGGGGFGISTIDALAGFEHARTHSFDEEVGNGR